MPRRDPPLSANARAESRGRAGGGESAYGAYNSDIARYGRPDEQEVREVRPPPERQSFSPGFGDREFLGYAGQEYGLETYAPRRGRSLPEDERRFVRPIPHGQQEFSWGGQGGGYGGAGPGGASIADPDPARARDAREEPFEPDYLAWREDQLRAHDEDYARWRQAQRRAYDDDYRAWRASRRGEPFASWRSRREPPLRGR